MVLSKGVCCMPMYLVCLCHISLVLVPENFVVMAAMVYLDFLVQGLVQSLAVILLNILHAVLMSSILALLSHMRVAILFIGNKGLCSA